MNPVLWNRVLCLIAASFIPSLAAAADPDYNSTIITPIEPVHLPESQSQSQIPHLPSTGNETDTPDAKNSSNSTRDPRFLSFIRNLLFQPSSTANYDYNYNQRIQAASQQQQYANYPEVNKYGEYLQSYPVSAQYNIGNNYGAAAAAAAGRPGPLSGYYPGSVTSVANPNYAIQNPAAAAGGQQQQWVTAANYNNPNNNYANYAQSVFGQLGGAGGGGFGSNLVNTNTQDSSSNSSILKTLMSALGLGSLGSGLTSSSSSNYFDSAGEFDPTALLSRIFDYGSSSMESLVTRMNNFDKLKCIPRLICQTIARRTEDAELAALTSTTTSTTTTSTRRPRLMKEPFEGDSGSTREGKFIKFQGIDTALAQFVNFLDLMQLKEWSLYPVLNGAYHGSQAKRADECRTKFETCPFSDQQLVYYFNNYNGGFFQSI